MLTTAKIHLPGLPPLTDEQVRELGYEPTATGWKRSDRNPAGDRPDPARRTVPFGRGAVDLDTGEILDRNPVQDRPDPAREEEPKDRNPIRDRRAPRPAREGRKPSLSRGSEA